MSKVAKYFIFMIFNVIFGFSALSMIIGGTWSMIKVSYNSYVLIFIFFGLFILIMCIIGSIISKKPELSIFYLISLSIIFAIEFTCVFLIKFVDAVNEFMIEHLSKIIDISED